MDADNTFSASEAHKIYAQIQGCQLDATLSADVDRFKISPPTIAIARVSTFIAGGVIAVTAERMENIRE